MSNAGCVVPVGDEDIPCGRDSMPHAPFSICIKHSMSLYQAVLDNLRGPDRREQYEAAMAEKRAKRATDSEDGGVVYYVRVGELIKIGTTRQELHIRFSELPPSKQLLATEPGGFRLEKTRHLQFRHLRAKIGEWFHPAPELWSHIAGLRAEHGEPAELRSRVAT